MELSDDKIREYTKRILMSRMRLLVNHGFYGILLLHVKFRLTDEIEIAGFGVDKNEYFIFINPKILDNISDAEIDHILMHEILHIALQHDKRGQDLIPEKFNIACDIVIESNILKSFDMDINSIFLSVNGGIQEHLAPNGNEGYLYTAEEVYNMLDLIPSDPIKGPGSIHLDKNGNPGQSQEKNAGADNHNQNNNDEGDDQGSNDISGTSETDNLDDSDGKPAKGHGSFQPDKNRNSSWKQDKEDKIHGQNPSGFDIHGVIEDNDIEDSDISLKDIWDKHLAEACESISIRDAITGRGTIPLLAERMWEEMRKPQTDWRTILNDFVQEEICDYSFAPPDRRFDESPFFLPDFNEKDETVEDILFMIDASGSMSNKDITAAYCEIKGAIEQFNGKLKGWLGFFDAKVIEPIPFENVEEFSVIRPKGGGGTDFEIIFEYVKEHMQDKLPASIIILTDGFAPFPQEKLAGGIPVLWLLNNKKVNPPWGKVTRITRDN